MNPSGNIGKGFQEISPGDFGLPYICESTLKRYIWNAWCHRKVSKYWQLKEVRSSGHLHMREVENQRFVGRPVVTENGNQPPLSWMDVGLMSTGVSVYSFRAPLGGINDDDIVSRLLANGTSDLHQALFLCFICLANSFNSDLLRIFGLADFQGSVTDLRKQRLVYTTSDSCDFSWSSPLCENGRDCERTKKARHQTRIIHRIMYVLNAFVRICCVCDCHVVPGKGNSSVISPVCQFVQNPCSISQYCFEWSHEAS